jgi:hypothetical protein
LRDVYAMMLGLALSLCSPSGGGTRFDYAWSQTVADASYGERDGAMLVWAFNKYWLIGGWNPGTFPGGVDTTNSVWSSTDLITWTEELAFNASPGTARFKRRHWFGCFTHTHLGTEYIYVLGGDSEASGDADFSGSPSNGYQTDIWRSANGTTWERVALSGAVPFAGRELFIAGSSGSALWVFGGQNGLLGENPSTFHNDLYRSTDGGATWTQIFADAAPSATRPSHRGMVNKLLPWRDRMWLISGGTYDTVDVPTRLYRREVWSFDPANPGAGFTEHTTPPWLGSQYLCVEVFNDRLWRIGGYSHGINTHDVWSSGDGERWERHEQGGWYPSHAQGTAVNGDTLAHAAGFGTITLGSAEVWKLTATEAAAVTLPTPRGIWKASNAVLSGSNITSIPDSSGAGAPAMVPNVAGDATYTASNAAFGGAPTAESNGGHFLHTASTVNLDAFTLFVVAKPDATDGLFYYFYSLLTGPNRYVYLAGSRTGQDDHETQFQLDILRGGVNTAGNASGALEQEDILHIYALHYDGTNEGTNVRLDGAKELPDVQTGSTLTGDAGTSAFDSVLYLFSDSGGTFGKTVSLAEVRLYPQLTLPQIQQVERELRAAYPYEAP